MIVRSWKSLKKVSQCEQELNKAVGLRDEAELKEALKRGTKLELTKGSSASYFEAHATFERHRQALALDSVEQSARRLSGASSSRAPLGVVDRSKGGKRKSSGADAAPIDLPPLLGGGATAKTVDRAVSVFLVRHRDSDWRPLPWWSLDTSHR